MSACGRGPSLSGKAPSSRGRDCNVGPNIVPPDSRSLLENGTIKYIFIVVRGSTKHVPCYLRVKYGEPVNLATASYQTSLSPYGVTVSFDHLVSAAGGLKQSGNRDGLLFYIPPEVRAPSKREWLKPEKALKLFGLGIVKDGTVIKQDPQNIPQPTQGEAKFLNCQVVVPAKPVSLLASAPCRQRCQI